MNYCNPQFNELNHDLRKVYTTREGERIELHHCHPHEYPAYARIGFWVGWNNAGKRLVVHEHRLMKL